MIAQLAELEEGCAETMETDKGLYAVVEGGVVEFEVGTAVEFEVVEEGSELSPSKPEKLLKKSNKLSLENKLALSALYCASASYIKLNNSSCSFLSVIFNSLTNPAFNLSMSVVLSAL